MFNVYGFLRVSKSSIDRAIRTKHMTEAMLNTIAIQSGFRDPETLLVQLAYQSRLEDTLPPFPSALTLSTRRENPQRADFGHYALPLKRPWRLACVATSSSDYFRFGFKLIGTAGRVFGDATIISADSSLLLHIGRNPWARPDLGLQSGDLFLTTYFGIQRLEPDDRLLRATGPDWSAEVEVAMSASSVVSFTIDREKCFSRPWSPEHSLSVALLAWGDDYDYSVRLADIKVQER